MTYYIYFFSEPTLLNIFSKGQVRAQALQVTSAPCSTTPGNKQCRELTPQMTAGARLSTSLTKQYKERYLNLPVERAQEFSRSFTKGRQVLQIYQCLTIFRRFICFCCDPTIMNYFSQPKGVIKHRLCSPVKASQY